MKSTGRRMEETLYGGFAMLIFLLFLALIRMNILIDTMKAFSESIVSAVTTADFLNT